MGESREGRAEAGPENATRLSMGLCQRAASPTTSLRPWAGARRPGILESMPRHPRGPWISNAIPCPLDESDLSGVLFRQLVHPFVIRDAARLATRQLMSPDNCQQSTNLRCFQLERSSH